MVLDDGTDAVFVELKREKEKEEKERILFGTPVKVRGNAVGESKSG